MNRTHKVTPGRAPLVTPAAKPLVTPAAKPLVTPAAKPLVTPAAKPLVTPASCRGKAHFAPAFCHPGLVPGQGSAALRRTPMCQRRRRTTSLRRLVRFVTAHADPLLDEALFVARCALGVVVFVQLLGLAVVLS